MWWSGLPGLDTPAAPNRALADQATAIACADRVHPLDPGDGGAATKTDQLAQDFRDWLADADSSSGAHARRLALCIACTHVTTQTSRGDILRTAKWAYRTLVK
jgi:hypothetical protein